MHRALLLRLDPTIGEPGSRRQSSVIRIAVGIISEADIDKGKVVVEHLQTKRLVWCISLGGAQEQFDALKKLGADRLKRRGPEKTRKPGAFDNALEEATPLERAGHEQPVEDAPQPSHKR
jgi:hypothetical protein